MSNDTGTALGEEPGVEEGASGAGASVAFNPVEQRAYDSGWRPKEEFSGAQEAWKTAGEYNLYGDLQDTIRDNNNAAARKDVEFDARLASLNRLHEAQVKAKIDSFKAEQRAAVEEADTARYDRLQTDIDNVEREVVSTPPPKDPLITAWELNNPWINDEASDKAQQAQAFWAIAGAREGATVSSAIAYVDSQIGKIHGTGANSNSNPRRDTAAVSEAGEDTTKRRARNRELGMSDLSPEESTQWDLFGKDMFTTQKEFLTAVADARKDN